MKTLLMSDFHGSNPISDITRLMNQGIERLICLGDYDDPEILKKLIDLEVDKTLLVGNHDHRFANEKGIFSPYVGPSLCEEYIADWKEHKRESDYIKNLDFVFFDEINEKKVAYSHSSLVDNDKKDEVGYLSDRLATTFDDFDLNKIANFREMQEKDIWILFRGHDHMHFSWSIKEDTKFVGRFRKKCEDKMILEKDRRHIVCIPCYREGGYAIFDSDSSIIDFHNYYKGG